MAKKRTKESRKSHTQSSKSLLDSLEHLTGKLDFTATNDYMFRAVLQTSEEALTGLLSALLDIPKEDFLSINVLNPIILGEAIDDKTIVLDLNILLNNNQVINLEMQVINEGDWEERSLYYLCKNFTELKRGRPYHDLLPVMHIGTLDFSLFSYNNQFYSEYLLRETKTHKVYSDKLCIRMLNLTQITNVPDEERNSALYKWAKLFKATTWEELHMLGKDDSSISKFTFTLHEMSENEKIRQQCMARERYEHDRASAISYGKKQGIEQGREQERILLGTLQQKLAKLNRSDDFLRAFSEPEFMKQLLKEFGLDS